MAAPESNIEDVIAEEAIRSAKDPIRWAKFAFDWQHGELADSLGPRQWQRNIMVAISGHLGNPGTRFQPLRIAVSSGHGIGKSALVAMLIQWAMSTALDTKIIVTANTATQLDTKTVPEVSKWFRRSINAHWFDVKATSIKVRDRNDSGGRTWRTDFIPWSDYNTEAFAGAHNQGKRIVLVFDEASAISDRIWEVAEGALTDAETEIIWLAFGNPTQNTGRFRKCFGDLKHRWLTFQIDSRTVEGTNLPQIDQWIQDYGEDSDFVRVRVRGEFPRAGNSQFIPSDAVAAARKFVAESYEHMPKIGACDVARFGDDQSVIGDRQGRKARVWARYRGLSTMEVAQRCIEYIEKEKPDAFVVDCDGLGVGTYDYLKMHGYNNRTLLHEFHGSGRPRDIDMYFNRRAEVWGLMRDWIVATAQIPDDKELADDLTGPQYGFSPKQQIQLEKKEDMKKRDLASPDSGDMLAMTFAVNVIPKAKIDEPPMQYGADNWMA